MGMIGHIKEVSIVDGQITVIAETGTGQEVTAQVMSASGAEFHPMPGDVVLCHKTGQDIVVSAVIHGDASTAQGESLVFSRDESGDIVASVHLKADGKVVVTPTAGVEVGNGTSPVALAQKVDALWNTLANVCNTFIPPGSPDGGAALSAAIAGAIQSIGVNTGSANLKAD